MIINRMIEACQAYLKVKKFIKDNELDDYFDECECKEEPEYCKHCLEDKECCKEFCCEEVDQDDKCERCGQKVVSYRIMFRKLEQIKSDPNLPTKDEADKALQFTNVVYVGAACTRYKNDFTNSLYDRSSFGWDLLLDDFYEIVYCNRNKVYYQ